MKVLICVLGLMASVQADKNSEIENQFNNACNQFTRKMFAEVVKENKDKSVVLSAFSVLTPLAQLSLAASGDTHEQLLNTIGLPNDVVTKSAFPLINGKLRAIEGVTLKQASKIYLPIGYELKNDFQTISRNVFDSEVKNIDFLKSTEAAKEMNTWVENQTNNRIKDLIKPISLDGNTRIVLVNAIYFQGSWKNKFEKQFTTDREFHLSKDRTIKVPMMYQSDNFLYGESSELDAKLLQMDYVNGNTSLLIILPREIEGVSALMENLKDSSVLDKAVKNMYETKVAVSVPNFKIETTLDLKRILSDIGLTSIFTAGIAQLDKLIKSSESLVLTEAIQKAFIEVNEGGTEAAAANEFDVLGGSSGSLGKYFKADQPFVFFLKHQDTQLFSGIYRS